VCKSHPDIYTFIKAIQKEQAYSKTSIAELSLGKRVKTGENGTQEEMVRAARTDTRNRQPIQTIQRQHHHQVPQKH